MHLVEEKALLLEPTDDETPTYSTLSTLESTVGRNYKNSLSLLQKSVDCEINTSKRGINLNFNETISNEPRHTYQHQLSVPLYRQLSASISENNQQNQRHRTNSVVERRLSKKSFISDGIIPFERSILQHSQLLSPRDIVLRRCQQSEPLDFSDVYSETVLQHCRKIGEGVYGEVFMNKTIRGDPVVLKIIPIEGSIEVNGELQKKFDKILSEIVIAMELSRLRDDKQFMTCGFVKVEKVCCVQGRYPDHLIDLWELYRDNCGSDNDHPEIFPDDQLYIVLELANGGQDLEAFTFQNALQSYSAFVQTALTLAVAEQKFKFEHRDLHWGNILLAPTEEKFVVFKLNGEEIKIPSHGVKVTIIDYTLSRMVFDGCPFYNDLADDDELFSATGDYQYDIYRLMKQRLLNQWNCFEPYTNILWLHYTIDKMISGARYRCSKTKKHRSAIHDMMQLRDELLDYKSASDYVECLK